MSRNRPDELRRTTAPALLVERARREPGRVAYRAKRLGLYEERSWADYAARVGRLAMRLAALGVRRGERVAIMGDACEEWLVCDQAAQALGAVVYGIYPTASAAEVDYQLRDGGAVLFVAEDQEYVDRVLPLLDGLPTLRHVLVIDDTALFAYEHPRLLRLSALMAGDARHGTPSSDDPIAFLEARAAELSPDDPAFIVYTSGTTGHPKGALASHGRHLAGTYNIVQHYPMLEDVQTTVVFLPLCHVLGRDIAITLPLICGIVPHFGEDVEDLATTLFEVAPTVLFAVPRYLQKFAASVLVAIRNTSPVKARAYAAAISVARRVLRRRWEGRSAGADALPYALARALVFRPVLDKLGFVRLRLLVSGGAPLPLETAALWQMWGVNVCEMYGQTEEAGAIVAGQRGPFPRPGDVGDLAAGWTMQLVDETGAIHPTRGEIWLRGDWHFDGYWNNPQATAEVMGEDGWLRTGDVGELVDGRLRLVDRARDFIVTAGGKTLSPAYVENALRASPYVAEAIVIGHARKYLTALIEIDFDTVSDWARANAVTYTSFTQLVQTPQVVALMQQEIERANGQLSRVETIKAFRILPKSLDPEEEGEPVTPTRKVKRRQMEQRFAALIESMYGDGEERLLAAGVGDLLAQAR